VIQIISVQFITSNGPFRWYIYKGKGKVAPML